MHRRIVLVVATLAVGWLAGRSDAQLDILSGKRLRQPNGQPLAAQEDAPKFTVRATILPAQDKQPAKLSISADIAPDWHIYSITQKPNGPLKTKINLEKSNEYRLVGDFQAAPPAQGHSDPKIWPGVVSEEHTRSVTWTAPIEFTPGVDPAQVQIHGTVNAQACSDASCLPPANGSFTAILAKPAAKTAAKGFGDLGATGLGGIGLGLDGPKHAGGKIYQAEHVSIQGEIEPAVVKPGGKARLTLTAVPDKPWHIYALADRDPEKVSKPTLIELAAVSGLRFDRPMPSAKPIVPGDGSTSFYDRPVSWTVEINVPAEATPGDYPIDGLIGFQTCSAVNCDMPSAASFVGLLHVGPGSSSGPTALTFTPAKYNQAAKLAAARPPSGPRKYKLEENKAGLPLMIVLSLLGGLILNLMPCVLPVIGLKVLAFVEQAGQQRSRILLLNLWYVAGILVVFLVLATLSVSLNLFWGERSTGFNIAMCGLVFAMALSFLGVWEIPLPGFVGSGGAVNLAAREGASGAFAKGIFTTILATPCSGPFLGSVFNFTIGQPSYITYVIFMSIGLGMASPYLLIGAFPRLVGFLPKPGAWMETFKQLMAFLLLATVVYIFSAIAPEYMVPTFSMLIGIWAACWWIGRTPWTVSSRRRALAWLEGAAVAAVVGSFSFTYLVPRESPLKWQPFSRTALDDLTAEGKTVMIDFTATWCPNCKLNSIMAIETQKVAQLVEANRVVPMLADWTQYPPEVTEMLKDLGSTSIPFLAIFPAENPNEPIILPAVITQGRLLEALEQAGPSREAPAVAEQGGNRSAGSAANSADRELSRN